jgi:hypothetical protein
MLGHLRGVGSLPLDVVSVNDFFIGQLDRLELVGVELRRIELVACVHHSHILIEDLLVVFVFVLSNDHTEETSSQIKAKDTHGVQTLIEKGTTSKPTMRAPSNSSGFS